MNYERRRGTKKSSKKKLLHKISRKNTLNNLDTKHGSNSRRIHKRLFLKKRIQPYMIPAIVLGVVISLVILSSLFNFGQTIPGDQGTNGNGNEIDVDFEFQDVYSLSNFNISRYKGSLLLIDFMYIDCYYCQLSIEEIKKLKDKYPQLEIFSVSIYPDIDTPDLLINHASQNGISWHVARDINEVYQDPIFQFRGTPLFVLIDKYFNIVEKKTGFTVFEDMEKWVISNL
ncbi:MAG: TlpA family protein disulfide reductase [Candidatus Hodarchaeales archaeon]|jgi:hypothetical protein